MAHAKQRGFGLARNAQQIARKAGMLLEHLLSDFFSAIVNYGYMR